MRQGALLLSLVVLFGGAATAQAQLETGPGLIGPGSPVYGLEVAWDNAAMGLGIAKPGNIAQERAAEAQAAAANGNYDAAQKAADQMSSVAEKARSGDTQGLQKAESVLQQVMASAPPEAQQGLQTALSNVRQARERVPEGTPGGPGGDGRPEPDTGGGSSGGGGSGGDSDGQSDQGGGGQDQSPDTPVQNRAEPGQ